MMNALSDKLNPGLCAGDRIFGYQIEKIVELPEINSFLYHLVHVPTNAKHIHISRDDKENSFCVAFKTVPKDSTGVAHILEHTVLCGSEKYPVRDPFFSMIRRSLNTFMNALTASDWTMYPFCTPNKKDYYNLMSVYLDATFFPKLDPLSFKQEGHRMEFEHDGQPGGGQKLMYKGVVYNEMKGAMSSPEQIMARSILNAIYPDTTYSFNSGGDPAAIPRLTHDQLKAFHKRHYHPSNAYFYTYGDLPLKDHLAFIESMILNRFERIDPKTDVPSQPRWEKPRTATYYYPIDPSENPAKKCQVSLSWLTADIRDSFEGLVLTILEQVLLGNPGSPLRKALIDSDLGSTLSDGTGYDSENKDTMFSCGLKDAEAASADRIEQIIFDTLKHLAETGIDKNMVASAIHQIEFHRKEVTNSPFPYGLKLLMRFCGDWFHGGDPSASLQFDQLFDRLFAELRKDSFLENRLKYYFIDNPHRVRVLLLPDPALSEKEDARLENELREIQNRLSETELDLIQHDAQMLSDLQNAKEDLSSLPTLKIEDIPGDIQTVSESKEFDPAPAICYDQPTSGIFYFSSAIGIQCVPTELLPLIPFFCNCLIRSGTTRHTDSELAQLIDLYAGGIGLSVNASTVFGNSSAKNCLPTVSFSAKCLSRNLANMFGLLEEILCCFNFSDLPLLKRLLLEYRADMESAVVDNGHRFAISLASRNYSISNILNETWHGIHQLKTIKEMSQDLSEKQLKTIAGHLTQIGSCILKSNNIKIALMGEKNDLVDAVRHTAALKDHLGAGEGGGFEAPDIQLTKELVREGWSTASAVSFVSSVFETCRLDHEDAPALAVISKILKSSFLHREIREKGGAYGGFAIYQLENGLFAYGSYRDPHIVNTLKVYEDASAFITSGDYTEENIKESILQICADIDRPDTPSSAALKSFYRKLIHLTDDMRRAFKSRLLQLNKEQVIQTAHKYFGKDKKPTSVAVISNEGALKDANIKISENPLTLYKI